ncbi:MAG: hypothetical protein LBR14_00260 [Clostridiales Family XIII bacterium]|nr:hypothetical protein [Clostridiales Family XIII bacterium]
MKNRITKNAGARIWALLLVALLLVTMAMPTLAYADETTSESATELAEPETGTGIEVLDDEEEEASLATLTLAGAPETWLVLDERTMDPIVVDLDEEYANGALTLAGKDQDAAAFDLTGKDVTWALGTGSGTLVPAEDVSLDGSELTVRSTGRVYITATVDGVTSNALRLTYGVNSYTLTITVDGGEPIVVTAEDLNALSSASVRTYSAQSHGGATDSYYSGYGPTLEEIIKTYAGVSLDRVAKVSFIATDNYATNFNDPEGGLFNARYCYDTEESYTAVVPMIATLSSQTKTSNKDELDTHQTLRLLLGQSSWTNHQTGQLSYWVKGMSITLKEYPSLYLMGYRVWDSSFDANNGFAEITQTLDPTSLIGDNGTGGGVSTQNLALTFSGPVEITDADALLASLNITYKTANKDTTVSVDPDDPNTIIIQMRDKAGTTTAQAGSALKVTPVNFSRLIDGLVESGVENPQNAYLTYDIATTQPTGLALEKTAETVGTADTPASVTYKISGIPLIRSMNFLRFTHDDVAVGSAGYFTIHSHTFYTMYAATHVNSLVTAANIATFDAAGYVLTNNGDGSFTVTAKEAMEGETLAWEVWAYPYRSPADNKILIADLLETTDASDEVKAAAIAVIQNPDATAEEVAAAIDALKGSDSGDSGSGDSGDSGDSGTGDSGSGSDTGDSGGSGSGSGSGSGTGDSGSSGTGTGSGSTGSTGTGSGSTGTGSTGSSSAGSGTYYYGSGTYSSGNSTGSTTETTTAATGSAVESADTTIENADVPLSSSNVLTDNAGSDGSLADSAATDSSDSGGISKTLALGLVIGLAALAAILLLLLLWLRSRRTA